MRRSNMLTRMTLFCLCLLYEFKKISLENKTKFLLDAACICMGQPMRRLGFWCVSELLTQVQTRNATASKKIPQVFF